MTLENNHEDSAVSKKSNEIYVRLTIYQMDCHPDEITQILGLTPTDIKVAGQPVLGPSDNIVMLHKDNAWVLQSTLAGSPEVEEQVDALIGAIAPHADRFQKLPDNIVIELSCVVYGYEYMPAIHFTVKQIQFISSIGAEIDVDIYDVTQI